ncbi:MAG: hypothetical protein ACM3TN_11280 [Alphaproteobacteria bacterium]
MARFVVDVFLGLRVGLRLVAQVLRAELDRARNRPPGDLAAYDYYLRGNALIEGRSGQDRGAIADEARKMFAKAAEIDPHYAPAVQGLAYSYVVAWLV